eukprot:3095407-Prymnesium_polylepis.1
MLSSEHEHSFPPTRLLLHETTWSVWTNVVDGSRTCGRRASSNSCDSCERGRSRYQSGPTNRRCAPHVA